MKRVLLIFTIMLFFIPLIAYADDIDVDAKVSINTYYKYGETSLPNATANIYKVANLNEDGIFTYLDIYNIDDDLYSLDTPEKVNKTAIDIINFIKENNIEPDKSGITNSEGQIIFKDLTIGLYIIDVEDIKIDKTTYSSVPTLVVTPQFDDIKREYLYDVDIYIKVEAVSEAKPTPVEPTKPEKKEAKPILPNTVDKIFMYVSLLASSLIIIIVTILLIKRIKKE